MQSTTELRRRRCACGTMFQDDLQCPACRPKLPAPSRSEDAVFRRYVAGEHARWVKYLEELFAPFLGKDTVKMSELIARLYGRPVKKKDAAA